MRRTIDQFMWSFQQHFRSSFEHEARAVFEQIGFGLGARAYLVGFAANPTFRYQVCFESETDPLAAVDLSNVVEDSLNRYANSVDSKSVFGSSRHHDRIHRGYRDFHRGQALSEALEGSAQGAGMTFFVARSALIEDAYEVHPILAVPTARWNAKPALSKTTIGRYDVVPSFQHAVVSELLAVAAANLRSAEAPENLSLGWSERSELIRKAARRFTESVSLFSGYEFPSNLAVALDEVSAQPYEGRSGDGRLLLAAADNPHVEPVLEFVEPIRVSDTRSMRKALEMADKNQHLLCDGEKVLGLAKLRESYTPDNESAFEFNVVTRGVWELSHAQVPLLRVSNTRPSLPTPPVDPEHFKTTARRVFPHIDAADSEVLWALTQKASAAAHGTILVVHDNATEESSRLVPQAQQVQPKLLDSAVLAAVTNIDGAVMVDTSGVCHAVGVILDGKATGEGDPSRGARYNSAVRYHQSQADQCMVIIVSEDGMINVLPDLRRQILASSVEKAIASLVATISDIPDYEVFFRHWRHLESLEFYLTADQCDRVNSARAALEDHRARPVEHDPQDGNMGRILMVGWDPFVPNPDMNPSYYLPEPTD